MRRFAFALYALAVSLCLAIGQAAIAGPEIQTLGVGSLFSNDSIVDGQDRWRTGSYQVSVSRGARWNGHRPDRFGQLIEYRFTSEIIAPSNLVAPAPPPDDRRFAGALSFGMHTHWRRSETEFSLGGGVILTGPQTHLDDLQREFHRVMGFPVSGALDDQIADEVRPRVTFETGQRMALGGDGLLRPFIEVETGAETLARAGMDVFFGPGPTDELLVRDSTTGQLYEGTHKTPMRGFTFTMGGDVAHVAQSDLLPASDGYGLTDLRTRVRVGVHFQGDRAAGFAGVTYLGREFETQSEGQLVGSVRLRIRF